MGNRIGKTIQVQDTRSNFNVDLPKFSLQTKNGRSGMIGDGKFMKSFVMRVDGRLVVVKVYMKSSEEDIILKQAQIMLYRLFENISPTRFPSLMPYQMWIRSSSGNNNKKSMMTPIYLIRQYLSSNLYDRVLTRPFLLEIEKFWLLYQLMNCLCICHANNVVHGDVKPENVLVTQWNFVVLTDFAPYKPTFIPDDDPSDFQYFFDSSDRRSCYVAPERFKPSSAISKSDKNDKSISNGGNGPELQTGMDVFSLGCIMAEVYLDCKSPLLDLPGMLQYLYSNGEINPAQKLDEYSSSAKSILMRVDRTTLREVLVHMTQKDPNNRFSVEQYMSILQGDADAVSLDTTGKNNSNNSNDDTVLFPSYFKKSLFPLYERMHWEGTTPDQRLSILCDTYQELIKNITGLNDSYGQSMFQGILSEVCPPPAHDASSTQSHHNSNNKNEEESSLVYERYMKTALMRVHWGTDSDNIHMKQLGEDMNSYTESSSMEPSIETKSDTGNNNSGNKKEGAPNSKKASKEAPYGNTELLLDQCRSFLKKLEKSLDEGASSESHSEKSTKIDISSTKEGIIVMPSPLRSKSRAASSGKNGGIFDTKEGAQVLMGAKGSRETYEGLVLLVTIIYSNFRHLQFTQSKIVALMLLVRIGGLCSDAIILRRIIPLLLHAMEDMNDPHVRATALRALTMLIALVDSLSPSEEEMFPNYIIPAVTRMILKDQEIVVKVACAESLGKLAETSKRFLDLAYFNAQCKVISATKQASEKIERNPDKGGRPSRRSTLGKAPPGTPPLRTNASTSPTINTNNNDGNNNGVVEDPSLGGDESDAIRFPYLRKLRELQDTVSIWVKNMVNENAFDRRHSSGMSTHGSLIRRILLVDISRIVQFLGQELTLTHLLPHLLTFFSDQDWELRISFWKHMPYVCSLLGPVHTEAYVLPGLEHGLVDIEEQVVVCALECLTKLCELDMLSTQPLLDFTAISKTSALLVHPSRPIRRAVSEFIVSVCKRLGSVNATIFVLPKLQDLLVRDLRNIDLTPQLLEAAVIEPLSLISYRSALIGRQRKLLEMHRDRNRSNFDKTSGAPALFDDSVRFKVKNLEPENENKGIMSPASSVPKEEDILTESSSIKEPEIGMLETRLDDINNDDRIIEIISEYLDASAKELHARSTQWRHFLNSGGNTDQVTAALRRSLSVSLASSSGSLETLLNVAPNLSLIHSLQTLMIPHQKFGPGSYYQVNEDARQVALDVDGVNDPQTLHTLFGLSSSASDMVSRYQMNTDNGLGGNARENVRAGGERESASASIKSGNESGVSTLNHGSSSNGSTEKGGHMRDSNLMSGSNIDPTFATRGQRLVEARQLSRRIKALGIPPLPPDVGSLLQPTLDEERKLRYYNCYSEQLDISQSADYNSTPSPRSQVWRPKEDVLVTSMTEHSGSVNRLAVCPDQSFFASASSDKTVKIWQLRGVDRVPLPQSVRTYTKHRSAVVDVTVIENSHSMASCSEDGQIHVWRVEVDGNAKEGTNGNGSSGSSESANNGIDEDPSKLPGLGVTGMGVIKQLNMTTHGRICNIQHFNGDSCSVLSYLTQRGGLHGWDLRCTEEAFHFPIRPELGQPTSMCMSPDRCWISVGTSKGYCALWDVRYNVMCKLWQHSSGSRIERLACCKPLAHAGVFSPNSSPAIADAEGAYLFVASGDNETSIFGIPEGGESVKCFRSIPMIYSKEALAPLPYLYDVPVPRHSGALVRAAVENRNTTTFNKSNTVQAMIGKTPLYLVTAGSDRMIRYWDFNSPVKCFVVSGLESGQPKSVFEAPTGNNMNGRLFVCYDSEMPSMESTLPQHLPIRGDRGPVIANSSFRVSFLHLSSILMPIVLSLSIALTFHLL